MYKNIQVVFLLMIPIRQIRKVLDGIVDITTKKVNIQGVKIILILEFSMIKKQIYNLKWKERY